MNVHLLIDAVVRQTTILVAQLATSGGARAALGHTANQVFLDLASELRRQGLNNKLIADLFGISLRTYHNKMRRLSESSTDRGRPLYNAVLDFVQSQGTVTRAEVLMRFCKDDQGTVKSVLHDLVETGIVFCKGGGDRVAYRAATGAELGIGQPANEAEARESLVWILIARHSPLSRSKLLELSQLSAAQVDAALERLLSDGRISKHQAEQPEAGEGQSELGEQYASAECVLPVGKSAGWEASVFDHYQAVVTAICSKLARGASKAERGEWIGGSTYSVEVWDGHPLFEEAVGLLQSLRDQAASLRARVDEVNGKLIRPKHGVSRVVTYVGQNVTDTHDMESDA